MPSSLLHTLLLCTSLLIRPQSTTSGSVLTGILINGQQGTQVYDPLNTPHATGNVKADLQPRNNARAGAAVRVGRACILCWKR